MFLKEIGVLVQLHVELFGIEGLDDVFVDANLQMPYWLFMAPMTIGMTLLTLESLALLRRTWRQGHADNKQTTLA